MLLWSFLVVATPDYKRLWYSLASLTLYLIATLGRGLVALAYTTSFYPPDLREKLRYSRRL